MTLDPSSPLHGERRDEHKPEQEADTRVDAMGDPRDSPTAMDERS